MRSGKSYEVVSEVIVPAIRSGRRVVTNVDGISEENIHAYLAAKFPNDAVTLYGRVLHVDNTQVFLPDFFPYYDDLKGAHTDTVVQPGDLVCIDEAWRFWPSTGVKTHKNHTSFFLEHGHFTNEKTNVACDLVLMIQDMGTLNRHLKSVVAFNFRTHKKVSLGLSNTYSVCMFEGFKQSKNVQIGNWVRKYNKEIFPLYSSFKGGADGVLVNADDRQNIFKNKMLLVKIALFLVVAFFSFRNIYLWLNPSPVITSKSPEGHSMPSQAVGLSQSTSNGNYSAKPVFNESWRISGYYQSKGQTYVVLLNQTGLVRLASPSEFVGVGSSQIGDIDGSKVTFFSGSSSKSASLLESAK